MAEIESTLGETTFVWYGPTTPGHGKTLVAAYLVGSRGTVKHAVALGAIVTVTHTASVVVIGLLALFASQFVVPDVLVPLLTVFSGLLVVFLGVRLVWQRWRAPHLISQRPDTTKRWKTPISSWPPP